jgi:hypothetical protein
MSGLEEVVAILEYQLTYPTLDELATNDLAELRLGMSYVSAALKQLYVAGAPRRD